MMSLLVVDDEMIIADGLYQMLQDTFQDELVVRRCYSFFEAQRILEANHTDILLTDIEMPDVSGLELHRWVSSRWPMLRVIYLTGYSDFDYARQALQQQAMAYVLKSEGDGVIVQAVRAAIQSLREESTRLLSGAKARSAHGGRVHQLIYHAMHGGSVTPEQFQQAFEETGAAFRADQPVLLGYCYFEQPGPALTQSMGLIEKLAGGRLNLLLTEMTSRAMMLICQAQEADGAGTLSGLLETAQFVLEKQNALMTVCLLDSPVPWSALASAGEWVLEQVNRTSPAQGELLMISMPSPAAQTPVIHLSDEWPEVLDCLKRLNEYLLTGQRDLYFEEEARLWTLADARQNRRQSITMSNALAMSLLHSTSALPQSGELRRQLEKYNAASKLDLHQAAAELHQFAGQFFELRGRNRHNRQRTLVTQVNDYVADHMEGDLSLTAIADAVHFHPVYLSRIYKEQAGVSLSDYIASQRLDIACALLRTTSAPISAVARSTGFTSANYFSRWFRKKTGMPPQEYRDSRGRLG